MPRATRVSKPLKTTCADSIKGNRWRRAPAATVLAPRERKEEIPMGIQDRAYWREPRKPRLAARLVPSAASAIIVATATVWVAQVLGGPSVTNFLAASPDGLRKLQVYKLVTAFFAHDPLSVWHVAWNMLFLYFFGRELEQIYGRRDFAILYFAAGTISILAETAVLYLARPYGPTRAIGASGAVMGVVALFTLFYPTRQVLFLFFIPLPVWALSAIFLVQDALGAIRGGTGVANVAHLAGAAVGFVYWILDLRTLRSRGVFSSAFRRGRRRTRSSGEVLRTPEREEPKAQEVSRRIDELLEKISSQGKESLSEEEWAFLKENSSKYRS